jgi:tRNA (mo5U34)-methyltransferase
MTDLQEQDEIASIRWYHEINFGDGLHSHSTAPEIESHRRLWRFIEHELGAVDFHGKTVLDIGAWDGYWSFLAERRGARSVLAADDLSQNWSDGRGIHLAKRRLGSRIAIRQDLSVYELASLRQTFDVILCLGVFYHLLDPFYALTQIRHCCHPGTILVLEGSLGRAGMRATEARYEIADPQLHTFLPSAHLFATLLQAAYLRVRSQAWLHHRYLRWPAAIWYSMQTHRASPSFVDRAVIVCEPFEGNNDVFYYKPPHGLDVYDPRFRE